MPEEGVSEIALEEIGPQRLTGVGPCRATKGASVAAARCILAESASANDDRQRAVFLSQIADQVYEVGRVLLRVFLDGRESRIRYPSDSR